MKVTPLYPPSIKPVRTGAYRTSSHFTVYGYSWWNNKTKRWGVTCASPKEAKGLAYQRGAYQNKCWRGLTKETK